MCKVTKKDSFYLRFFDLFYVLNHYYSMTCQKIKLEILIKWAHVSPYENIDGGVFGDVT